MRFGLVALRIRAVAAIVIVAAACSGSSGSPIERAVKRVKDARPVLLPTKVPPGYRARVTESRSFYAVTYKAGSRSIELEIEVPNLAHPQRTLDFRHDAKAEYEVDGEDRSVAWWEPGRWNGHIAGARSGAVPYVFATHGVPEAEFWSIARSLRSVS